jgi:hypothetical protein
MVDKQSPIAAARAHFEIEPQKPLKSSGQPPSE